MTIPPPPTPAIDNENRSNLNNLTSVELEKLRMTKYAEWMEAILDEYEKADVESVLKTDQDHNV